MQQRAVFWSLSPPPLALVLALVAGCGAGASEPVAEGAGFVRLDDPQAQDQLQPEAEAPAGLMSTATPEPVERGAPRPEPTPTFEAPEPAQAPPREAAAAARPPAVTREEQALAWLEAGEHARAARALSELLLDDVSAGHDDRESIRRHATALRRAQAGHRWNARGAWPSIEVVVQPGDSLIAVRKRVLAEHPDWLLCTGLIQHANQLASATAIRPDDLLRIPTDRPSILVDLSAMWAFYFLGDEIAAAWEVGIGREGNETRAGTYTVGLKQENPMWAPVGREPVPFGDPENPLGTRWMAWHEGGKGTSLGFHGTNDAGSVGRRVSDGCIRMRNEDVELLFEITPLGAEVRVQP